MNTLEMISVSAIAAQAGYDIPDAKEVTAQLPKWCVTPDGAPLYVVEVDEAFVSTEDKNFVIGFLHSAAEHRREKRMAAADERLVSAYDALKAHPKMPQNASEKLTWQSVMLGLFAGVTDALSELLDAKLDAKAINPTRAARIRSEAAALQATAELNVQAALRKALRMARGNVEL